MARVSRRASYPLATGEYVGEESWSPAPQSLHLRFRRHSDIDSPTRKPPRRFPPHRGNSDQFLATNRPRRLDLVRMAHRPLLLRLRTERRRIDVGTNPKVVPVPMFSVPSRGHTPARRCNRRGLVGTPSVPITTSAVAPRGGPRRSVKLPGGASPNQHPVPAASPVRRPAPTIRVHGPSLFPGPGHTKSKGSAAPTASNLGDDLGDFVESLLQVRDVLPYSSA